MQPAQDNQSTSSHSVLVASSSAGEYSNERISRHICGLFFRYLGAVGVYMIFAVLGGFSALFLLLGALKQDAVTITVGAIFGLLPLVKFVGG